MIVLGQRFSPPLLERLEQEAPGLSRRRLAHRLCEWVDWRGPSGRFQEMAARKALVMLERAGHLKLPPAAARPPARRQPAEATSPMPRLSASLEEVSPVSLVLVPLGRSAAGRIWRQIMEQEHYLGAGPLCGAQLRYLIDSPHGYLGALAFSAAAWRLGARERWIGWSEGARVENLHRVVNNSRFLIGTHVAVPNLASHVLTQALAQLPQDWQGRYGYQPVLVETFVELGRFPGISYQAANWQAIGLTQGRGRQDARHEAAAGRKAIWVQALRPAFRSVLCAEPPVPRLARRPAPAPPPTPVPADWAEEEWAGVALGDERLRQRLLTLTRDFYARPTANLTESCGGNWAKYRAGCRFFAHPRTGMHALLSSHYAATMRRVAQHSVVLAVQDTTSLNYTAHGATQMIGPIGPQADGAQGLLVHDTMAFTVEGTPLGLLNVQCWARDREEAGKKHQRNQKPVEAKESAKWLHSARAVAALRSAAPQTLLVSVGDREADVYDLFVWAAAEPTAPRLLVRAMHDRAVRDECGSLWAQLQAQPALVGLEVRVPRRGSKPARRARLEVRYRAVELEPPVRREHLGRVRVWAVLASEANAPAGVEPIEWMLLTTVPVNDPEAALERVRWYVARWNIEVYHRTLKSGCRIQDRQLRAADQIESCLAIDMVVAWRVFHLTKLGRETPQMPCTICLEDDQWKALMCYVTKSPIPPSTPPSLWFAITLIAKMGGWLGRKCDGPPGAQVLWRGLAHLDNIVAMWQVMTGGAPETVDPAVSSNFDYG